MNFGWQEEVPLSKNKARRLKFKHYLNKAMHFFKMLVLVMLILFYVSGLILTYAGHNPVPLKITDSIRDAINVYIIN